MFGKIARTYNVFTLNYVTPTLCRTYHLRAIMNNIKKTGNRKNILVSPSKMYPLIFIPTENFYLRGVKVRRYGDVPTLSGFHLYQTRHGEPCECERTIMCNGACLSHKKDDEQDG
ncbi:MAG: hypothetical protein Sylvanvirus1_11 [Sylvanvirus sp.]|uniref:Uncharacterized protein n=1 Tax=Sylvanvirus sp. TaxID=2487774 RepID=A0A3G5AGS6_9VIRU|nr:MAG: hypothetical protein Sylvanvirus1_11 [Sylvanvirus sp.]